MDIFISFVPDQGYMAIRALYAHDEIKTPFFYINRDTEDLICVCDGTPVELQTQPTAIAMLSGYIANQTRLPTRFQSIEISYRLRLSGSTGCFPYVRETISPEFTFIRWETFCYPMFFNDWDSFRATGFSACRVHLTIPSAYTAIASIPFVSEEGNETAKQIHYASTPASADVFDCAIAQYHEHILSFQNLYLRNPITTQKSDWIESSMTSAKTYMDAHFGFRDIPRITYAVIPDGFGSFSCAESGIIYLQESALQGEEGLNQMIHEFIHQGWNAKAKDSVQRARFFDEAFTCFFEALVTQNLTGNDMNFPDRIQSALQQIGSGFYKCIPICEYGEYEYGDLSYTVGAFCLYKLYQLLGEPLFCAATSAFLADHAVTPADFHDFCEEYICHCGRHNEMRLRQFFDAWIYGSEGIARVVRERVIPEG